MPSQRPLLPVQKSFLSIFDSAVKLVRKLVDKVVKSWLHYWTKSSEIERICAAGGYHTSEMSYFFAKSVRTSSQLAAISAEIFSSSEFSVDDVFDMIIKIKGMKAQDRDQNSSPKVHIIVMNITHCLNSLKHLNIVIGRLEEMLSVTVNSSIKHHSNLLEEFWSEMRPGVRRQSEKDWGEVGFQGMDPCSDFRGMGLLGLQQLLFLSKKKIAAEMLLDAGHSRRFYPFACTGINVTAFTVELLREGRLHRYLFRNLELSALRMSQQEVWSTSAGFDAVHEVYCEVFELFSKTWQARDPPNVMHFKDVFGDVKSAIHKKYAEF